MLRRREFPVGELTLLGSARSAGATREFGGERIAIRELGPDSFAGVDVALFSAGAGVSREWAPRAVAAGAVVVDNSSAFRQDPDVPLVIPEINAADAAGHRGILANPNCTTAVTLMALGPLHRAFGLKRLLASSYQAASGAGARGITELRAQTEAATAGRPAPAPEVFAHPIAFNVLPQVDAFLENGYTKEEVKLQNETRKILHLPALRVSCTCVRVPVYRAHSVAVQAEFERPVSVVEARRALAAAPGLDVVDDPANKLYPTPLAVAGRDHCQVGRLRLDTALDNGLAMWIVGDQLLKGAALNAVQIAELI